MYGNVYLLYWEKMYGHGECESKGSRRRCLCGVFLLVATLRDQDICLVAESTLASVIGNIRVRTKRQCIKVPCPRCFKMNGCKAKGKNDQDKICRWLGDFGKWIDDLQITTRTGVLLSGRFQCAKPIRSENLKDPYLL